MIYCISDTFSTEVRTALKLRVSQPGLLSLESQKVTLASPGLDLKGTINGMPCLGHGQFLSVPAETEDISGLTVRYYGSEVPADKVAGTVSVIQNGFQFRVGMPGAAH